MKKITFLLIALTIGFFTTQAQTISLIGDAVGGWNAGDDVDLATTDNNIYTLTGVTLASGGLKFRQDHDWPTNWGAGDAFPSGTAALNGGNFTAVAGTYDVSFNLTTLEFSFVSNASYPEIGIIGSAINGGATTDTDMFTTDGTNYFLNAFDVATGDAHFRQDNAETINWSSAAFPSGTGTLNGDAIPVTANTYNITLDITSGAYNFDFVTISLIGQFNSWSGDTDLTTTDGENYTLNGFVLADTTPNANELKFRQNHDWSTSWGGTAFPNGTAILNSIDNLPAIAGTYDVTFVRSTGVFTFTSTTASINDYDTLNAHIKLYPTVTNTSFKVNTSVNKIAIYSISGSLIKSFKGEFEEGKSFNISELQAAMYFVNIESNEGNNVQRLIVR